MHRGYGTARARRRRYEADMTKSTDLTAAPFQIAALALAWRSLEAALRQREQKIAAIIAVDFEAAEHRACLIAAIEADTQAQALLLRELVTAPARDIGDVLHKLAVVRETAIDDCARCMNADLLASAMRDLERRGGYAQAA
jgi:hypothetical protein